MADAAAMAALLACIRDGDARAVSRFTGDVNASHRGRTPLSAALGRRVPRRLDVLRALHDKGVDVSVPLNDFGTPPLFFAADSSSLAVEVLQWLLDEGADVNVQYPTSLRTPLHQAIEQRQEDKVLLLLSQLATDVSLRDFAGKTAWDVASELGLTLFSSWMQAVSPCHALTDFSCLSSFWAFVIGLRVGCAASISDAGRRSRRAHQTTAGEQRGALLRVTARCGH
jgi:ankyrin repeat protein